MAHLSSDLDPARFHDDQLPALLGSDRGALAGAAARGLGPLVLKVDQQSWTYREEGGTIEVSQGEVDEPWVEAAMDAGAWSDLATSMRTAIALHLAGELTITAGTFGRFGAWESVLRALYLGIPAYDPTRVQLVDDLGGPIDLTRTFSLADDDDEMSTWLHATGFLHLTGVFDADEVAELQAATDQITAAIGPDDPMTWWATRPDGSEVLCRVIYAQRLSPLMGDLATDPRMERLARLLGSPTASFPDRMDGPTVLIKPSGELQGLSNLPWHQDCGLGLHPITCPAISLGIQITGSSAEVGRLEVIAGSHGQSVPPGTSDAVMTQWPKVAVNTNPGDVTVHIQDVLHASPPPTGSGGRATLYLSYYPPNLGEHIGPGQAVNDLIRGRQHEADAVRSA